MFYASAELSEQGDKGAVALPALFLGGQGGAKCPFWNRNSAYNIVSLFSLCVPLFTPMCPKSTILSRNVSFSVYTCALLHHQCAIFNTPTCPSKLHVCPFQEFKCPAKYEDALFSLRLSFPTPCAFLTSIRVYPFQSTCALLNHQCALLNTPICPSKQK